MTVSSVVHCSRARNVGIVKLGEKVGRAQNYEIDWKAFLKLFIKRSVTRKFTHVERHKEEIKTLVNNRYFKQLVKLYICQVLNSATLLEAMQEFENGLHHSTTLGHKESYSDDDEKQEFFNKMALWRKRARDSMSNCELTLLDSLERTLERGPYKRK